MKVKPGLHTKGGNRQIIGIECDPKMFSGRWFIIMFAKSFTNPRFDICLL